MRYLLGTDEAGYGPNLGPLVVAATAWQVPKEILPEGMYKALRRGVCTKACEPDARKLAIADSKLLYKPGCSLAPIERGVLAALSLLERLPTSWRTIWQALDNHLHAAFTMEPWHAGYDEPLPIDLPGGCLSAICPRLRDCFAAAAIKLVDIQAAVVFPSHFNDLVDEHDNKAEALSLTTLRLARRLIEQLPEREPVQIMCDKHGGRCRYAALLQHVFPDELVRVVREQRELGVYELRFGGRQLEFHFLMNGERMLPTALASMTAKYLRELAMRPFNTFWQSHVPGLRPTAGYPTDSRRFLADILAAKTRLQIGDRLLWRER